VTERGRFITFEGPEGGGKSTQAARLSSRLSERGINVIRTREPGGTLTGEAIRDLLQHDAAGEAIFPETETLLFAASRAQLVRQRIAPALSRGSWVISDRFADSTTAYQGYGRGFAVDDMLSINAFATNGATPDLTLLMDVDLEIGMERVRKRNEKAGTTHDRMERETRTFHERVRAGYLELADRYRDRIVVVDASKEADEVARAVWTAVVKLLETGNRLPGHAL
jgi:dTMP kinase